MSSKELNSYVLSWIFYTCRRVRCRRPFPHLWRHCLVFNSLQIDSRFRTFSPYINIARNANAALQIHKHLLNWIGLASGNHQQCLSAFIFNLVIHVNPISPASFTPAFLSPLPLFLPVEYPNIPLMSVMFLLSLSLF